MDRGGALPRTRCRRELVSEGAGEKREPPDKYAGDARLVSSDDDLGHTSPLPRVPGPHQTKHRLLRAQQWSPSKHCSFKKENRKHVALLIGSRRLLSPLSVSVQSAKAYKLSMPRNRFNCIHHFRNVVTTSAGQPSCRECGLTPTAEELESLQPLLDWDKARQRANLATGRQFSPRRTK